MEREQKKKKCASLRTAFDQFVLCSVSDGVNRHTVYCQDVDSPYACDPSSLTTDHLHSLVKSIYGIIFLYRRTHGTVKQKTTIYV
jgi:hypothetical protein